MSRHIRIRRAKMTDIPALQRLIGRSSRELGVACYGPALVEKALESVLGVDRRLIKDGCYFIAECTGRTAGCGGWSFRNTLYGSDAVAGRDDRMLDPTSEAARIRAFFVHPGYTRMGIASRILERCEAEARAQGFRSLELGATLSGVDFYLARGFEAMPSVRHELEPGVFMEIVPMRKELPAHQA
ncbi:MAG: GNAT family N-acetyltransferase [Xanthomonadales bacterium]|nr:GNAT family N-acetyltransferase [Xanthomonadales bacterium]